jgi:RNA polymerase-binding transcription factor DksA
MDITNSFCYCDKCGKPIDAQPNSDNPTYSFCPECAAKLFQKIFGDQEAEQ